MKKKASHPLINPQKNKFTHKGSTIYNHLPIVIVADLSLSPDRHTECRR